MAKIRIGKMVLGVCQTNTYFVYREQDETVCKDGNPEACAADGEDEKVWKETIVIDPADYGTKIYDALNRNGFRVKAVLLTHGHFDHIWGCEELVKAAGEDVKIYACAAEQELLEDSGKNVSAQAGRPCTVKADVFVKDGDIIEEAGMKCKVITTPGHTAGGCCYYFEEADLLVSGDTLFQESVGRTDLPTGSMGTLVRSIKEKLLVLPENTQVYPGHGDSTTIDYEKKYNPFL